MSGPLEHPPSEVVRQLLITLGQGTDPDDGDSWPVYTTREPPTPDSTITITNTTGKKQGRFMRTGEVQEFHGIQVRIRAATTEDGFEKARAVAIALDTASVPASVGVTDTIGTGTGTYTVANVSRVSDVIDAGQESPTSKRHFFTINALVTLRQT